jgi:hypothetical protein
MLSEQLVRDWLKNNPVEAQSIVRDYSHSLKVQDPPSSDLSILSFLEIAKALYSSLELPKILQNAMSIAVEVLKAEKCSVLLANNTSRELYSVAWDVEASNDALASHNSSINQTEDGFIESNVISGVDSKHETDMDWATEEIIRVPFGKGIAGIVAETQKGLCIKDAYQDHRFNPDIDKKTGFRTKSIICLPVFGVPDPSTGKMELLGVATCINKNQSSSEEAYFGDSDIQNFQNILLLVGIAITNSFLFENVRKSKKELSHLYAERNDMYEKALQETKKTKILLDFAMSLYKEDDIKDLTSKIILHARDLLQADRASVFIVDRERKEVRVLQFHN